MHLFNTSITTPLLLAFTFLYFLCAAITTFDIRYIQAKRNGLIPTDTPEIPAWTGIFGYAMWGLWIVIFLLNWWYALVLFAVKFMLKLLPILERVGAFIYTFFVGIEVPALVTHAYANQMSEQRQAGKALKRMQNGESPSKVRQELEYDKLVKTLNQVKHGNSKQETKWAISQNFIRQSDLTKEQKADLIAQMKEVYKRPI